ncbi:hypothetical protein [Streptomyces sp. 1222.5]|uniref:hypothetical protein n=1 Tax=Streptomyces sp. 1222.5 TaxID=1881026 RepID=UPI003EBEE4FB
MTLSYSRAPFCCFTTSQDLQTFFDFHRRAFAHCGGVPMMIVYDRTKPSSARSLRATRSSCIRNRERPPRWCQLATTVTTHVRERCKRKSPNFYSN